MSTHVGRVVLLALSFAGSVALAACGSDDGSPAAAEPEDEKEETKEPKPVEDDEEAPACADATGSFTVTKEESNVLFLYDRSGSMHITLSDNKTTRWNATKKGFFDLLGQLPATIQAGAILFPQGDKPITNCFITSAKVVDCTGTVTTPENPRCQADTYKPEMKGVAAALLEPAQVTKIKEYVSASDRVGKEMYWGTPLAAAVAGAIQAQKSSAFKGTRSVVLLTDGNPTSCDDNGGNGIQRVVDAAAAGLASDPPIRTFVMGVVDGATGASPSNLSPIAKAGGTARTMNCDNDSSCFYQINAATFQADIKKAFDAIALQAFDCTFAMPEANENSDASKVNVSLTTTASGKKTLAKDPNHQNGWDTLPGGTQLQLYGQACTDMKADPASKVDVVIGCKTFEKAAK